MTKTVKTITPRENARTAGAKTYIGNPCSRCNGVVRCVANGACCECAKASSRRHKANNKERYNLKSAEWYHANKDRSQANTKSWVERNYDRNRETAAIWRSNNAEYHRELCKAWQRANRNRKAVIESNRRANHRGSCGRFTLEQVSTILYAQGGKCSYCDETQNLQIDHVIPISRGGSNWPWNLQWLCAFHNASKNARTDSEYRALIGLPALEEHLSMIMWRAVLAV